MLSVLYKKQQLSKTIAKNLSWVEGGGGEGAQ